MVTNIKDETISGLKATGQNFRSNAEEAVSEAKDDLRLVANKAGRSVRQFLTTANDEIHHAAESVGTQIQSKPIQSGLIALGAGFLLGLLARR